MQRAAGRLRSNQEYFVHLMMSLTRHRCTQEAPSLSSALGEVAAREAEWLHSGAGTAGSGQGRTHMLLWEKDMAALAPVETALR
jgi:hypothetical protein